jgi:hypothetical protein
MLGFEGKGQPAQNSLWSESEQPAPECALPLPLSSQQTQVRRWGGTRAICFASLFGRGRAKRRAKREQKSSQNGNLHFLAQSIFEGLETGTGGGARTQREKGMPLNDKINASFLIYVT